MVDFMRAEQCRVIIRGLRALSDFEYEFQLALMNRQLAPEIETFFIVTEAKYSYLSSRAVKEVFHFGGAIHDMVPPGVFRRLRKRFPPGADIRTDMIGSRLNSRNGSGEGIRFSQILEALYSRSAISR